MCRERIRIRCGHRRASNSARADQATSLTEAVCRRARHRPAKLGNTSPAAVPLPPARRPTLASTTPTFRSEGICSGRGGGRTGRCATGSDDEEARWRGRRDARQPARRTDGRRLPSIRRHFRVAIRTTADPADCSLPAPAGAQSDKFPPPSSVGPSFVESERPVVPPNAGAGRVKIKANLSHALRYQFSATCRPDVGVYHPPRPIYRMFRTISHSSRNLSSH